MLTRRIILVLILVLLPVLAYGASDGVVDYQSGSVGTVVEVPSKDGDVTMFTYPANPDVIAQFSTDENTLAKTLAVSLKKGAPNTAAFVLLNTPTDYDEFARKWIQENLTVLPPPFLFVMSAKLDDTDTKAALQWYLRGTVLARVDAMMCRDKSARQGVTYLKRMVGENLRKDFQGFVDSGLYKAEFLAAVDYARDHSTDYDPMWLCSHGMSSFTGENPGYDPLDTRKEKLEELARQITKSLNKK